MRLKQQLFVSKLRISLFFWPYSPEADSFLTAPCSRRENSATACSTTPWARMQPHQTRSRCGRGFCQVRLPILALDALRVLASSAMAVVLNARKRYAVHQRRLNSGGIDRHGLLSWGGTENPLTWRDLIAGQHRGRPACRKCLAALRGRESRKCVSRRCRRPEGTMLEFIDRIRPVLPTGEPDVVHQPASFSGSKAEPAPWKRPEGSYLRCRCRRRWNASGENEPARRLSRSRSASPM